MGEICCRSQDSSGKVYIIEKQFSRKLKEQMKNSRLLQPDKSTLLFYAAIIAEKIFKTNYEVLVVKVIPVNP